MIYLLSALLYAAILFVVPGYSYYRSTVLTKPLIWLRKMLVQLEQITMQEVVLLQLLT